MFGTDGFEPPQPTASDAEQAAEVEIDINELNQRYRSIERECEKWAAFLARGTYPRHDVLYEDLLSDFEVVIRESYRFIEGSDLTTEIRTHYAIMTNAKDRANIEMLRGEIPIRSDDRS